jgi:hypothetical protein
MWEGHIVDATSLCLAKVMAIGVAAIGSGLTRRLAVEGNMAIQHGQEALAVSANGAFGIIPPDVSEDGRGGDGRASGACSYAFAGGPTASFLPPVRKALVTEM